jgi:nucleotide-binding universal stress UspA family protein
MYQRVLLAYDGSLEGRTALREGALLARQCGAQVFLLAVLVDTGISLLADVAHAGAFVHMENAVMDVLNEGRCPTEATGFRSCRKAGER